MIPKDEEDKKQTRSENKMSVNQNLSSLHFSLAGIETKEKRNVPLKFFDPRNFSFKFTGLWWFSYYFLHAIENHS